MFATTMSYFSVSIDGEKVLLGTIYNCIFSGSMLFRAAFWRADAIAWVSISIPTELAAPNCVPSQDTIITWDSRISWHKHCFVI